MLDNNMALLQTRGGGWLSGRKAAAAATDNSTAVVEEVPEKDGSSPDTIAAANEESPSEETPTETATTTILEPETSVISDEEGGVEVATEETEEEQESSTVSIEIVEEEKEQQQEPESVEEEEEEEVQQETPVIIEDTEDDIYQNIIMKDDADSLTLQEILEQAAALRKQGKLSHDEGRFSDAAAEFHEAANLLDAGFDKEEEEAMEESEDDNSSSSSDDNTLSPKVNLQNEWATCRLHESLCHLKAEDYEQCIEACSSLLDTKHMVEGKTRARAHHRRAKAKVATDDIDGALVDAKSAAMLGDQKAVAYYGNLLRDTGRSDATMLATPASPMSGAGGFPDSSLLESLLNKSGPVGNSGGNPNDFLTSSLLGSLTGSPMSGLGGSPGGGGGLAKSVLSSLSKKLEDESTHDGICQYLQSTNPMQVQSMANMAGVPLTSGQATKLVSIAHGITPKTIRTTVKTTKRAIWGVQLIRKTMAVISKYRTFLLLVALLQFTKSAILRPIPVPKVKAPRRGRGAKAPTTGTPPKPNPSANTGNAGAKPKPATPGIINNNLAAAVAGR